MRIKEVRVNQQKDGGYALNIALEDTHTLISNSTYPKNCSGQGYTDIAIFDLLPSQLYQLAADLLVQTQKLDKKEESK